ncbi:MAG: hypothetical protein ACKO1W_09115 [Microcystaceae cyanobacterium]
MKKSFFATLFFGLSVFWVNGIATVMPAQAQDAPQVTNTLILEKPGEPPAQLSINGTEDRVNPASVVGAISLGAGVTIDAAQTGINLTLAGADPESVANLMLAMGGMVTKDSVDLTRLALSINAFNSIVQKADLDTLKALQDVPEFTDIRTFLFDTSKPILQVKS